LYAELVLETGQAAPALREFEAALKENPNRYRGLYGAARAAEAAGDQEKALYDLMHNYTFDLGAGFVRTMSDFLVGFGLVYGVFVLFLGLINLVAIRQAADSPFLRSLCWLNVMCMAVVSAIAFKFFFLPPLLFAVVPFLPILGAALTVPRQV